MRKFKRLRKCLSTVGVNNIIRNTAADGSNTVGGDDDRVSSALGNSGGGSDCSATSSISLLDTITEDLDEEEEVIDDSIRCMPRRVAHCEQEKKSKGVRNTLCICFSHC